MSLLLAKIKKDMRTVAGSNKNNTLNAYHPFQSMRLSISNRQMLMKSEPKTTHKPELMSCYKALQ